MAQIEKRNNGTYRIRVFCGYSNDGKKLTKSITWHPPDNLKDEKLIEYEAKKYADEFEQRCRNGGVLSTDKFAEFCENTYFPALERKNKTSSQVSYRDYTKRVYDYLGNKRLVDITPIHIDGFIHELCTSSVRKEDLAKAKTDLRCIMYEQGFKSKKSLAQKAGISEQTIKRACDKATIKKANADKIANALNMPLAEIFEVIVNNKKISAKTVRNYFCFVSGVFSQAVRLRILDRNPCDNAILPRYERPDFIMFNDSEASIFLKVLSELNTKPKYKAFFMLLLDTGARRGEVMALRWSDIQDNTLYIKRAVTRAHGKYIYGSPKTKKSKRVVRLGDNAASALKELKAYQDDQANKLGDQWHPTDQIFTTWDGHQMHPSSPYTWLTKTCKKHGITRVNVHSFRHWVASHLILMGYDTKTVQEILGHSQASTTLDIYAAAFQEAKMKALGAVDDMITQLNKDNDNNEEDKNHD